VAISLRKKSSDAGTFGLDIDGRFLAAAQVRDGRLEGTASAELPPGVLADGEVADRAALTAALKDFVTANKLPRRVLLGVSNQQIVVRVLELPRIDDKAEREAALRFSASEAIAMPLDEAVLDHQIAGYSTASDGGERMQVVVVAARRTMIEEYLGAVKDAGLKAEGIDLDAFALVRLLAAEAAAETSVPEGVAPPLVPVEPTPGDDGAKSQAARVICHLGGVSNLAIALGDSCFFCRTLSTPFGADGAGSQIANEIRLSIDYYRSQPGALPVGDVLVSGEGALDAALVADLSSQLAMPVAAARPLGSLDPADVSNDEAHRYTVAAGLAMGAAA
jgi:type IV pilus assembly protein PilM